MRVGVDRDVVHGLAAPVLAPDVRDVRHLGHGVEADVALEREVDVVVAFRLELALRHDLVGRELGSPNPSGMRVFCGLSTKLPAAARRREVVERRVRDRPDAADERAAAEPVRTAVHEVVEDARRGAHGGLAVAEHVPRQTDARGIRPHRVVVVPAVFLAAVRVGRVIREPVRPLPVGDRADARHDRADERAVEEHVREPRVNGRLVGRRAGLIARHARLASRRVEHRLVGRRPQARVEARVLVAGLVDRAVVLHAEAVVQRQP